MAGEGFADLEVDGDLRIHREEGGGLHGASGARERAEVEVGRVRGQRSGHTEKDRELAFFDPTT